MPRRKQRTAHVDRETTYKVERVGDRVVFTHVESVPAVIPYDVILACCRVEPDELHSDPPWEDCDGWEHETVDEHKLDDMCHYVTKQTTTRRLCVIAGTDPPQAEYRDVPSEEVTCVPHYNPGDVGGRYPHRKLIRVNREQAEKWGIYGGIGDGQLSRQVAFERAERIRRKAIDQLVSWYDDGWSYCGAVCEYMDYESSVWGIDDEEYAEREVFPDVASDVVDQMEKDGFTITRQPPALAPWQAAYNSMRWRMARSFGFESYAEYKAWVTGEPVKLPEAV